MRANKRNPILIQISSNDQIIGHMTCEEFRNAAKDKTSFIGDLCKRFNETKKAIGEPERAKQVINTAH